MIKYVYCLRKRADLTDEESHRVYVLIYLAVAIASS